MHEESSSCTFVGAQVGGTVAESLGRSEEGRASAVDGPQGVERPTDAVADSAGAVLGIRDPEGGVAGIVGVGGERVEGLVAPIVSAGPTGGGPGRQVTGLPAAAAGQGGRVEVVRVLRALVAADDSCLVAASIAAGVSEAELRAALALAASLLGPGASA